MSGWSGGSNCSRCGGENFCERGETRPIEYASGECVECGFSYNTLFKILSLEEVNEIRIHNYGLDAIKSLLLIHSNKLPGEWNSEDIIFNTTENIDRLLGKCLEDFKKQYPMITSGDLQAFILGFKAAINAI